MTQLPDFDGLRDLLDQASARLADIQKYAKYGILTETETKTLSSTNIFFDKEIISHVLHHRIQ